MKMRNKFRCLIQVYRGRIEGRTTSDQIDKDLRLTDKDDVIYLLETSVLHRLSFDRSWQLSGAPLHKTG